MHNPPPAHPPLPQVADHLRSLFAKARAFRQRQSRQRRPPVAQQLELRF